jgi:hypothetical protein
VPIPLLGRRTEAHDDTAGRAEPDVLDDESSPDAARTQAKGRPTPKRRDAERRRRQPYEAPATKREAYKRQRSRVKSSRREQREAMARGDERALPARDAGPVRRYVRDYVDRRRNIGGLFMPGALVLLAISAVLGPAAQAYATFLYVVLIVALIVDSVLMTRRVRRAVTERFGAAETKGVGMYAVMRALQFRRLRMTKPAIQRGQQPR